MFEPARPLAKPTVQVDNDRVRVTEWRFPPGGVTGWHKHEFDYVVVPQTTGRLTLKGTAGAPSHGDLKTGVSYYRDRGVEHDVINDNPFEFVFVEIEVKR